MSRGRCAAPIALARLPELERAALRTLWRTTLQDPPPKGLSHGLMAGILAYEFQARAQGRLSPALTRRLLRFTETEAPRPEARLRPGARLLREWNGVSHLVEVRESGFLWQGRRYRSLSAVARAITAAKWSGPRFFGVGTRG